MVLQDILLATIAISLISLLGIIFTERVAKRYMCLMVSFAAGALLGAAFLDLIPEAIEDGAGHEFFMFILGGFLLFFILEKFIYWWHCHEGECDIHPFSYLALLGDAFHNFLDGVIIAATFMANPALGWTTTFAVGMHEIPQELGDYAILRHGGFSKLKALGFNFLSAVFAVVGALITYFGLQGSGEFQHIVIALAAGGFIYIAAADLVPEIHKVHDSRESLIHFAFLVLGMLAVYGTGLLVNVH